MVKQLTIKELQEFRELDDETLTVREFKEKLRTLRDKHKLNDQETLSAYRKSKKILPLPNQ